MNDLPRTLKVAEVAEILQTRKIQVYELIRRGVIPAVRFGRLVRVPEDQFRAWLASGGEKAS